jgi:3-methyladenine DNA glycosylase AlkD
LEALGTEQARKTYKRHGIEGDVFGVSYANLEILRKKIKVDHDLAQKLWASGNHDARILATMFADTVQIDDPYILRKLPGENKKRVRPEANNNRPANPIAPLT